MKQEIAKSSLSSTESDPDLTDKEPLDMAATAARSQSAVDFRRKSSTTIDTTGINLHINPNRARTPRSNSVISQNFQNNEGDAGSVPKSEVKNDNSNEVKRRASNENSSEFKKKASSEKTPLLEESSIGSEITYNFQSASGVESSRALGLTGTTRVLEMLEYYSCSPSDPKCRSKIFNHIKVFVLFVITILCCGVLMSASETEEFHRAAVLTEGPVLLEENICHTESPHLRLKLHGPFYETNKVNVTGNVTRLYLNSHSVFNLTVNETAKANLDAIEIKVDIECKSDTHCNLSAVSDVSLPVMWSSMELSWQLENEVIYAFLVLGFVYILIIFELVHRTLAALLGALAALAVLSSLNERPTLEKIVEWIDMETLTLLFGMMILVAIFSETGFFDFSALVAYKLAKGRIWPLITLLCVFSAVVSAFLDNVTTILLMAPVTIRLCEVLNLEPRRILIAEVLFSNIGGTATAIGDPPNVIIVGALSGRGITFSTFTMHVFPGIIFISFLGYGLLRLYYRNMDELKNKDPPDISEMKHEIAMWRRAANRLQVVTREETLMKALFMQKAVEIEHVMNKTLHRRMREERQDLHETIRKLETQYCIKNYPLLIKSGLVLFVVVLFLFMYSFVDTVHLDIGWIAVLGALWLLVLADVEDIEAILHKVEWSTLLFFAALFILMEALAELGMIKVIGDGIADIITSVNEEHRLLLGVLVILWVSAIASSFIDNIPYTTAMVPVLIHLADNPHLDLPLLPLVIALAFGACLGGNGTLIGASCNVVCAGIAEQHGYGFSFREFFKVGFPMMLVSTLGATGYVLLCHIALDWNSV